MNLVFPGAGHLITTHSTARKIGFTLNLILIKVEVKCDHILGDPGAVSGGGKKSKRVRKNSGEKKSRRRRRAPGDKVLTDQFQTAGVILASDWCQKTFVFFCPITERQD